MRDKITKSLSKFVQRIGPKYIAGPAVEDAIRVSRQIHRCGWSSTICPWDSPHESPTVVASRYRKALHAIGAGMGDCYLSIKVPSLNYDFDVLKELLEIACQHNTRIHLDSLGPDTASASFAFLEKALKTYSNLGCTLPSRWRRSLADAEVAIQLGLPVRVVKGQWPDPTHPDDDSRASYLALVDVLSGRAASVGIATHDVKLAVASIVKLKNTATRCELEQLYGLPLRIAQVATPLRTNVRVYIPYGHAYLPYALSEIRKRPVVVGWLLRDALFNKVYLPDAPISTRTRDSRAK